MVSFGCDPKGTPRWLLSAQCVCSMVPRGVLLQSFHNTSLHKAPTLQTLSEHLIYLRGEATIDSVNYYAQRWPPAQGQTLSTGTQTCLVAWGQMRDKSETKLTPSQQDRFKPLLLCIYIVCNVFLPISQTSHQWCCLAWSNGHSVSLPTPPLPLGSPTHASLFIV